jgi:exportin-1
VQNTEVFKTCLDYWNFFVPDIYSSACSITVSVRQAAKP